MGEQIVSFHGPLLRSVLTCPRAPLSMTSAEVYLEDNPKTLWPLGRIKGALGEEDRHPTLERAGFQIFF